MTRTVRHIVCLILIGSICNAMSSILEGTPGSQVSLLGAYHHQLLRLSPGHGPSIQCHEECPRRSSLV